MNSSPTPRTSARKQAQLIVHVGEFMVKLVTKELDKYGTGTLTKEEANGEK